MFLALGEILFLHTLSICEQNHYNKLIYIIHIICSIKETQDEMSIVGRDIQLTKDYTTGNATFKQGRRGTVIEATSRKDRRWKVKFNNDIKKYRLIKGCDLQLYEGVAFSPNS